ncbi:glucose-1-phosphate adenylyltransferase [candidate division KSB1 bacterium]|nr:glucose-1-phosphate adenylyltransferase [candidate division KSB1 bacterium]
MSYPVTGIILAGGKGTRLYPLTRDRSKPAVPIAGKFRLIDIPISNCLHSDIRKIFILTQFNSESLNRHIAQSYSMPAIWPGFIQILAAEQRLEHTEWFQGTADAVRQNLMYLWDKDTKYYIVLSGDQLYRMDYDNMLEFHKLKKANITICVAPVLRKHVSRFGILNVNGDGQVTDYVEKPAQGSDLEILKANAEYRSSHGIKEQQGEFLASMGIYIFTKEILFDLLETKMQADFAGGIFPYEVYAKKYTIYAHPFTGYWEDIGTIRTFFDTMLTLTTPVPPFNFYDANAPVFTHPRFLPGAKIHACTMNNAIVCEGAIIQHSEIFDSIIGIRSIIRDHARLSRVVMMGADYYQFGNEYYHQCNNDMQLGIGRGSNIEDAIIDKNACIGDSVQIVNLNRPANLDNIYGCVIKDGILIVPKNACIPDGTRIP